MSRLGVKKVDVSGKKGAYFAYRVRGGEFYLLLGVLQMALMRAMAEARLMAGWVRLPATQERRTVEPE